MDNHYQIECEPLIIHKSLIDKFLEEEFPGDLIALYTFYYYTAKWQGTNQTRATTSYSSAGLKWSEARIRKTKQTLIRLGLVEDKTQKDAKGQIIGHYVYVRFLWSDSKTRDAQESAPDPQKTTPWQIHTVGNRETNALSLYKGNALSLNSKTLELFESQNPALEEENQKPPLQSRFEEFWQNWPDRSQPKQPAKKAWEKIIKRKFNYDVQAFILNALETQKQSKKHLGKKDFLPHASTWLNQERWLDEVRMEIEDFVL